jgi:Spy/CpxP family protein refolding chaperone
VGIALMIGLGLSLNPARAESPPADTAIAELNEHHRHHQHGGITQFIELSLDTLGEDEARRPQVEKLQSDLHECMEPVEENEKALLLVIATGVAAGSVDAAKVKAGIEQLNSSAGSIHPCVAGLLNQLHAVLLPQERAELGDKVRAHWAVWRQVNHDAEPGGREPGGRLADLARELKLSPDQLEKMSAALHAAFAGVAAGAFDPERVQRQVQAFATAFVGDAFDANSVTTNSTAYLTGHGTTRMALFYQTITAQLTSEQRTTLAAHLREHADHHAAASAQ